MITNSKKKLKVTQEDVNITLMWLKHDIYINIIMKIVNVYFTKNWNNYIKMN